MTFRRIVWPLAVAETLVWAALYYSFPALLLEWERNLGWSKTELAGALTLALVTSALLGPVTGRLIDRGFGRVVFSGSAALGAVLLAGLAWVEHLWQFYCVWFGIGVAMAGSLYDACFSVLTHSLGKRGPQSHYPRHPSGRVRRDTRLSEHPPARRRVWLERYRGYCPRVSLSWSPFPSSGRRAGRRTSTEPISPLQAALTLELPHARSGHRSSGYSPWRSAWPIWNISAC